MNTEGGASLLLYWSIEIHYIYIKLASDFLTIFKVQKHRSLVNNI